MRLVETRKMAVDIAHFARDSRNHPLLDEIDHLSIEEKHAIIVAHMQVVKHHAAWKQSKMPSSLTMRGGFRIPPAVKRTVKLAKAVMSKWK